MLKRLKNTAELWFWLMFGLQLILSLINFNNHDSLWILNIMVMWALIIVRYLQKIWEVIREYDGKSSRVEIIVRHERCRVPDTAAEGIRRDEQYGADGCAEGPAVLDTATAS